MSNIPIGIDLGTTYSAIAKWENKPGFIGSKVYTLPLEGADTIPSKIVIDSDENIICGKMAIQQGILDPDNYFSAFKRNMDDNAPLSRSNGETITPVELSSLLIENMLQVVESIEEPGSFVPECVVVSVPYYFKQVQNVNTREAVIKALKKLYSSRLGSDTKAEDLFVSLIPEPVAAGLDYAFQNPTDGFCNKTFLVFDLGGGTFDITIFKLNHTNKSIEFEVLAVGGDDRLGGEDFDKCLLKYVLDEEIDSLSEIEDDPNKKYILSRLIPEITETKQALSQSNAHQLIAPNFFNQKTLNRKIGRQEFESCIKGENGGADYLSKIDVIIQQTLNQANLKVKDISSILLVGGSSQIPLIKQQLEGVFGSNKILFGDLSKSVAKGAALYAAYLSDEQLRKKGLEQRYLTIWDKITIKERTAHKIGVITEKGLDTVINNNLITPAKGIRSYQPNVISEDGKTVELSAITIAQGTPQKNQKIGVIEMPIIFTHGRSLKDITISIELIAESTLVKARITVPEGHENKEDISIDEIISLTHA